MGALLGLLLPLIPSLVQGVEGIFNKPNSGTNKMDAVLQALRAIGDKLVATGITAIPGSPAAPAPAMTDDLLRGAIEAVVQQLKASGQLTGQVSSGSLYILQGTVTPLKAGV